MTDLPATMKAVVFHGPRKIAVEDRPTAVQDPKDVIVKVQYTALCGSELHVYRGHQPSPTGFIMGHEFVGTVVQAGDQVKSVSLGDTVVAPFTVSCMDCFYCTHGASSRCTNSLLFGCEALDGGQAEYVRVPHADGTVDEDGNEEDGRRRALVLMADIFPTGFFGAKNAFGLLREQGQPAGEAVVVVVGCGPVGLCAIVSALERGPRRLFAVDSVPSRLERARALGAEPLNFLGEGGVEAVLRTVREATDGRGADAVIEVVGLSPALRTAFDLVRPFGVISSIGVHNAEIPWSGDEAYSKNLRLQMGRCPVRSIFPEALPVLVKNQDKFSFMFDKIMPLSKAAEGYDLFDQMKVQKVIFKP
ncbi:chaperonin 10-like protein [Thermothelomyces heterothallicus CBS 202.75]|uniref:chaperonin 10-like protein n=1 Tax=Thermothelomyces heterothallicus CBS 202.75 TaxID=1149848 RepID=UPI0037425034